MSTSTLVLAPHGDDESLFVAYTCMRERAHVIVCTQDRDPEVRQARSLEVTSAIRILGCTHQEWQIPETEFGYRGHQTVREYLQVWDTDRAPWKPERVYAPALDQDGHDQHNLVGALALEVFAERVIPYLTYAPRGQRQRYGQEVVPTAEEIQRKLKALACYRTQIENPATRPWFFDLLDLREWLEVDDE